ncbi:hypothetical protein Zmor_001941 [Zophobas morio]|uniref:Uncharacterized protein n=1 Tax=Zophobas morio TaxID=2755281 RepID=A0AA38MT49_9CUCU|nr:hypothetical protein Zmor_001941 [Zophobas morio]
MCERLSIGILEKANELRTKLLPAKSKNAYEKVYVAFNQWTSEKGVKKVTEDVIRTFLDASVSTRFMLGLCSSIIISPIHLAFFNFLNSSSDDSNVEVSNQIRCTKLCSAFESSRDNQHQQQEFTLQE